MIFLLAIVILRASAQQSSIDSTNLTTTEGTSHDYSALASGDDKYVMRYAPSWFVVLSVVVVSFTVALSVYYTCPRTKNRSGKVNVYTENTKSLEF